MALGKILKVRAWILLVACAEALAQQSYKWTRFVQVEGQPEPIPAEWVATPEGKFAHSIKIPNPLPKISGYRRGMTSKQYFEHLCKTEAGEFIQRSVEEVEGFYFARPPRRPTDDDLKDRYKLEAPEIERTFQLLRATTKERAGIFIAPPFNVYKFIEEPNQKPSEGRPFIRAWGYWGGKSPMQVEDVPMRDSRYGLTWRGIRRANDRELAIAGSEWIVFHLESNEVLAVHRNYALTGFTRNTEGGIWWLNAISCPVFAQKYQFATSEKLYDLTSKVLKPIPVPDQGGYRGK